VYIELYRDIVKLCPLFRACNEDTQREICFRLKPVFRAADTQLTQQGEDPDSMYIVRFGSVVPSPSLGSVTRPVSVGRIFT
jgi:hypothetical protein